MKIVAINGKRLVFGLEWRLLVDSGSTASLASQACIAAKASLLWHDGKSAFAGLAIADLHQAAPAVNGSPLSSAAIAFSRLPGLPSNALLIVRMPDSSLSIVGIIGGRPRRGYDRGGLTDEEVRDTYFNFGSLCGKEGFAVVGDVSLPFVDTGRIAGLGIEELAGAADGACVLKAPSRAALFRKLGGAVAVIGAIAVAGLWFWSKYHASESNAKIDDPQKQAREFVKAHLVDPVVPANSYGMWLAWIRSLSPAYGGWTFQSAVCFFHNKQSVTTGSYTPWDGVTNCSLTFLRTARAIATNETFVQAIPQSWRGQLAYDSARDAYRVDLHPMLFRRLPLQALLVDAGTPNDRDIRFMSLLQSAAAMSSPGNSTGSSSIGMGAPSEFLPPPIITGGVPPCGQPSWSWTSWHFSAQLRYADVLAKFPAGATLTSATVTINPTPPPRETPFLVDLTGEILTRNPLMACARKEIAQ